jgi:hypothetical protein
MQHAHIRTRIDVNKKGKVTYGRLQHLQQCVDDSQLSSLGEAEGKRTGFLNP